MGRGFASALVFVGPGLVVTGGVVEPMLAWYSACLRSETWGTRHGSAMQLRVGA
jgi:hypothetical protein